MCPGACSGGCVSGGEGVSRGCVSRRYVQGRCVSRGGVCPGGVPPTPAIVDRMPDACENITSAALLRNTVRKNLL